MKVTIIGGSGFIGTRIVDHFTQFKGYDFRIVDIRDSHFFNDITTIGDVRNQQQMDSALAGTDLVILLAAQHRDNVTPTSLYYDTNVGGMRTTLHAMERNGVKRILFFSSVAVYGINKDNPDETSPKDPFNHYGKSKWQAEQLLQEWHTMHADWNINVVRPTVTFGERNRGNVYNLLHQIQSRHFLMVGNGRNRKSMAYVGNIVAFVKFLIDNYTSGYNVFNYIDKPDYDMNQLVQHVETVLQKRLPAIRIPYAMEWLVAIASMRWHGCCAANSPSAPSASRNSAPPPNTTPHACNRPVSNRHTRSPMDLHGLLNSNSSIPAATKSPTKRNNLRLRLLDFRNCRYFNTIYRYVFNE